MSLPRLAPNAEAENRACEAVVLEYAALLTQQGAPPVIAKLCKELAGRIELRRLSSAMDAGFARLEEKQQVRAAQEQP